MVNNILPLFKRHVVAVLMLSSLIGLTSVQALAGPTLDRIKKTGTITLAHRESSIPFSYHDANRKPVGYALELCQKLSEAVRKTLQVQSLATEYVLVTSSNRIEYIEQGKADMECGSTTNNAERREKVAFTVPHYITGARFMVKADSKASDLPTFQDLKLVSTKGTTPLKAIEKIIKDRTQNTKILEASDHNAAVEMVETSKADGFAMDDVLLYGLIASRPNPEKLKVVGKFLTIEPLAIMVSKSDPEFKAILDLEMKRLISSREAYDIYAKWFLKPIPPNGIALNLPMNYLLREFWKYPTDIVP